MHMMVNNQNCFQIEPTVHHPIVDQLNIKKSDLNQKSGSSSPFQVTTPRIQMNNRDDSPVIKFFDSKQTAQINGTSQQFSQKTEDQKNNLIQQPLQQVKNTNYQNFPPNNIQLLKESDQQQQKKNFNISQLQEDERLNQIERDQFQKQNHNNIRYQNLQNLLQPKQENETNALQQERNSSLPLQIQQYTKPSLLLEKITNTFKNKSPKNNSLERQFDSKDHVQNNQLIRNDNFSTGQTSTRQTRAPPQIFQTNQRIFQQNIRTNNQFPLQNNNNNQQYVKIPINQSNISQSIFTSNNTSPNSRVITKPEFSPQSSYILRTQPHLNDNMQTSNSFQNQQGFLTDRSFSQNNQKQILTHSQPIFHIQNNGKVNPLNTSLQLNPTIMSQNISNRNGLGGNDNRLLNRSLNYFPSGMQENQSKIFSNQQSKQIPQAFIVQQNNLQPFQYQQSQQPQLRPNQQMQINI